MRRKLLYFIFALFLAENTYSVSIDAAFMRKTLDENKFFIEFINVHLTNFISDEYLALYKSAVERDFDANTFYLSGDFVNSYKKVIDSQKDLRLLYYKILTERYEPDTTDMLRMSSPIILLSKDKKAEYFLRMGYNYLAKAIQIRKYGFGVHKFMLSQKIKFYMESLNNIFRAKRYATFALVESTIPIIDKQEYKKQTYDEAMKNIEKLDIETYDYIRNELINNLNKKSLPATFHFLLHHDDNYHMIFEGKKSVLNTIGDEINARVKDFKNTPIPNEELNKEESKTEAPNSPEKENSQIKENSGGEANP